MAEALLRVVGAQPLQVEAWAPRFPGPQPSPGTYRTSGADPAEPGRPSWASVDAEPLPATSPDRVGTKPPNLDRSPTSVDTSSPGAPPAPDPWPLRNAIAQRSPRLGPPGRLIALLQAAPVAQDELSRALGTTLGNQVVEVSLPAGVSPDVTAGLIASRLAFLTERADLVLLDLGCRWVPALFRPILTTADAIWLIGPTGEWPAFESRLAQAEFSGWTDLKRLHLIALGRPGAEPPPRLHTEPIQILDGTADFTRFAQTCLGRMTR